MAVAEKTFGQSAQLPLDEGTPESSGALAGRRRLAGAFAIAIDRIRPDPNQPRSTIDPMEQAELVRSIRRLGILQAISVRFIESDDIYQIIAGERRYLAAREAGLMEMPCWVQSPRDDEVLLQQIVENWQRSDLHPFDLADSLARLKGTTGFTQKELAAETGKSEGEISKLLSLLTLDPDVQKLAREDTSGRITKRHLYSIVNFSPQTQRAVIDQVLTRKLTVEDTEQLVANEKNKARPAKRGAPVTRLTFRTTLATVVMTFRRKDVASSDVICALDEVRRQLRSETH